MPPPGEARSQAPITNHDTHPERSFEFAVLTRVASTIVFVPVVAALLAIGGLPWVALVAGSAAVAALEMHHLQSQLGRHNPPLFGPVVAAALVMAAPRGADVMMAVLTATVVAAFGLQLRRPNGARSAADWSASLSGPVYIGVLFSFGVLLRGLPSGFAWTALLLWLVWWNDSAAYLVGRKAGRNRLAPILSPKKTWEGFAAGTAASVLAGAVAPALALGLASAFPSLDTDAVALLPPVAVASLGLLVALLAPAGDLSKSFLKRQAGVKDAGHIIPGHGGMMDRVDSLLFAAPAVYYCALWLGSR
jgi:phosphatidate cytidylyltransferase